MHIPNADRYPTMKLTQIKTAKASLLPKLKGTGQQCKGIARVMRAVFLEFCDTHDPYHELVLEAIDCARITNYIYTKHRSANRIPPLDAEKLIKLTFRFCQITTRLCRDYHKKKMCVFHYTIKSHYSLHIAMTARYLNPWHSECSSGEDYMKVAKRMVQGASRGNPISEVTNVAIRKYMKAFYIERNPRAPWWKKGHCCP